MRARSAVLFVLLVGVSLCGAVAFSSPAVASTADIEIGNTLAQSSSEDRIDVETWVAIPDSVVELEIVIPEETEVYGTNGFERVDDRTYEWDGITDRPTVRYEYQGTARDSRGDREGVRFVVTDEWALVRTPSIGVSWASTAPEEEELVRENAIDGEGTASTHIAYLGSYTEHTAEGAGQRFRLVVPDAADLREDPADILAAFEASADRLTIGDRGPEVFVIAAPTAEHTWVAAGVQRGSGGDMWVRDAERLGTNRDTWIHEYVHTRQRYGVTDETRWTLEGMADYYAALLPYEAGDIDYDDFVERLEAGTGDEYDDVRLVDPSTWVGTDADYDRGMLVFAYLDRKLRAEADTTLDAVIADINTDDDLTQRRFLDAVEAAGGSEIRADLERYTETTATPPIPTRSEHVEAFGGPDVRYSIDGTSVSGPYRNGSLVEPRLVTGETLELNATARNVGTDSGPFEAEFRVDGETVAVESGHLESGETAALAFSHEFDASGEVGVSVGGETLTATVEEPAALAVTELVAEPNDPAVDESVRLRATVEPAADRPAAGEVVFTVDGEALASERVRLAGGSTVVETTVSFDGSGERTVSVGDRSVTVTIQESEAVEEPEGEPGVIEDQPGLGVGIALVALAGLGLFARRE